MTQEDCSSPTAKEEQQKLRDRQVKLTFASSIASAAQAGSSPMIVGASNLITAFLFPFSFMFSVADLYYSWQEAKLEGWRRDLKIKYGISLATSIPSLFFDIVSFISIIVQAAVFSAINTVASLVALPIHFIKAASKIASVVYYGFRALTVNDAQDKEKSIYKVKTNAFGLLSSTLSIVGALARLAVISFGGWFVLPIVNAVMGLVWASYQLYKHIAEKRQKDISQPKSDEEMQGLLEKEGIGEERNNNLSSTGQVFKVTGRPRANSFPSVAQKQESENPSVEPEGAPPVARILAVSNNARPRSRSLSL